MLRAAERGPTDTIQFPQLRVAIYVQMHKLIMGILDFKDILVANKVAPAAALKGLQHHPSESARKGK